jgi:hypothetical protein
MSLTGGWKRIWPNIGFRSIAKPQLNERTELPFREGIPHHLERKPLLGFHHLVDNLPTRPPAETWAEPPDEEALTRAVAIPGDVAEIVHPAVGSFDLSRSDSLLEAVVGIVTRHPMRQEEPELALSQWAPGQVRLRQGDRVTTIHDGVNKRMSRQILWIAGTLLLAAVMAIGPGGATRAFAQSEQPVAYVVLFYSPTCPHCASVIEEELPALQQEFGEQLQLLLINAARQKARS